MTSLFSCRIVVWAGAVVILPLLLVGCLGTRSSEERPPDERFGHRADAADRQTVTVTPPDSNVTYFFYPAPFDTVVVRPAPFAQDAPVAGQQVAVEVLIKGAFPDACSELHELRQERTGHIITAILEMRKPQGRICASVRRPYRFYAMLEGRYGVGNYTLDLNDNSISFSVQPPPDGSR